MIASGSTTTYVSSDAAAIAKIYDFLESHQVGSSERAAPQYALTGSGDDDRVEVPDEVHQALRQVIDAMKSGLAVAVIPQSKTLTTQQAADLLDVSRPTIIKMLDAGEIAYEKVGTHRRIQLGDLLDVREARRQRQYEALESMSFGVDDETPIDDVIDELKAARKAVSARRRRK